MSESKLKAKNKSTKRLLRLRKKTKKSAIDNLPSVWTLFIDTYRTLIKHWRPLGGVVLIYAALYFLFVRAAPNVNLNEYRDLIDETLADGSSTVKTFTLAGVALTASSQAGSGTNSAYGLVLFIVVSLALIWALRHLFAGKKFNIRDTYYRGMTPFVTYSLTLLLIAIQLLPFALGGMLFALVKSQGIAVTGAENLLFVLVWLLASLLSGWLISNSVMASYAVTLPGMYPWAALKATKQLVQGRRWLVLRKQLFLPFVLIILYFVVFLFWISIAPGTAFWFIDLALITTLPIAHSYYYNLYRSLV